METLSLMFLSVYYYARQRNLFHSTSFTLRMFMNKRFAKDETDEVLLEISLREKEAFSVLVGRYEAKLIRYVRRIGGKTKEATEDIVQNSFIKAYN